MDTNPVIPPGLTGDELEYLRATRLLGIRPRDVAEFLRWSRAKTERVRSRLSKRLGRLRQEPAPDLPIRAEPQVDRGSSLHTSFVERLDSGRRIYSLTNSKRVGFPTLPIYMEAPPPMKQPEDLQATLRQAKAQFDKHVVASQLLDDEVRKLEGDVDRLRDSDDATLLAADYPQRLAEAQRRVTEAGTRKLAMQRVVERQQGAVQEIEAKISSRKHEDFAGAVGPLEAKMYASLEQFLKDSVALADAYAQFPDQAASRPVFRSTDANDPFGFHIERLQALNLYRAAIAHFHYRAATRLPGHQWHAA
jgi:hypothetical protein